MTPTPHDALFRSTFSHPGRAAELLRSFLDPDLCSRIDWPGLTLQSGSFVDEQLRAQHTDLLFTARLDDRELRIYLLLEHQSNPDRWIALWLLRYMVRIWVAHVDAHPRTLRLPLILPAVIHHGEKAWTIDPTFSALFDIPDGFTKFIPHF
jgi:predicted transposase YdaD